MNYNINKSNNQVPKGYKKTKVGVIPDDWKEYLFSEIFIFSTGKNIKQDEASKIFNIPCVRYGELYHMYNEIITKVINKTNLDKSELLFSKGDEILLPSAGEDPLDIGSASALTLKDIAIGRTINILRPAKINIYSQEYMAYHINHQFKRRIASLAKGSSISNVYNSDLKNLKIPLPPLKEQKKIANILTTWDDAISKQDELIKAKEELKKGLMQKLLTGMVRFKEFSDDIALTKLSKICIVKKGQQLNKLDMIENGEYFVINGGINKSGYTDTFNTNENTITISEGGNSCGYVNYITSKFWSGGHCYSLLNVKIDVNFLYQYLKFNELNIMKLRVGSGLPNIQKGDIENFKINIPSLKEQEKIAQVLNNADKEIDLLKNGLQELKEQKRGLMQKLLSGEVRVKI